VLGKRSAQRGLFEADTRYGEFVGQRTFYGYLASERDELFRDDDFAALYSRHRRRPSVPPSLLATALVLQTYDGVSDEEAKQRADYDLRWKVALGLEVETRPFAKSTLQEVQRGQGGRTVQVHPQEALLQQARTFQKSPAFAEFRRRRQVVEHRLARLVQLGIRQARYIGRTKTLFQLCLAAAHQPRWVTCWSRRQPALSEHRSGSGGTAAPLHAAGGSPRAAMLAGLPMPIRLPGVQSQVHLHIGIYVTPNELGQSPQVTGLRAINLRVQHNNTPAAICRAWH
jgi:hypothetical protein